MGVNHSYSREKSMRALVNGRSHVTVLEAVQMSVRQKDFISFSFFLVLFVGHTLLCYDRLTPGSKLRDHSW